MLKRLRIILSLTFFAATGCSALGLRAPWDQTPRQDSFAKNESLSRSQVENRDARRPVVSEVHLGMSSDQVQNLWGTPSTKEWAAGKNPRFQRWVFEKTVITSQGARTQTRWIYIEDNRVVGWETR